jgi:hypothetical protein
MNGSEVKPPVESEVKSVEPEAKSEGGQSGGKRHSAVGSRAQVWHGTAKRTPGGLQKKDLLMNKHGRIVSKAKSIKAKKEKRLEKAGYFTKKGKFGYVKKEGSRKSRKSRK